MLPRDLVIAIFEEELLAASAWAGRNGVLLQWNRSALELRVTLAQRSTGERFHLRAITDLYKGIPPEWNFCDCNWQNVGAKSNYPNPGPVPGVSSTIFHTSPVICAPFNRLAYQEKGGPHADWGNTARWMNAGGANVRATTIADMLAVFLRDLSYSKGRMA